MSIWKKPTDLEFVNSRPRETIVDLLDIVFTEVGEDYLVGTMPVDARTHQPFGILHGGASCVLAETLGSVAGNLACAPDTACVGLDINANHISKVSSGLVTGKAKAVHVGRQTQVWQIDIHNEDGRLVCTSRLTLAVIQAPSS